MIVDDNPDNARTIIEAIQSAQWVVSSEMHHSGKSAIDALRRNYFGYVPTDLVVMSSHLDGSSCVDTLRVIRNHAEVCHQPIIIIGSSECSEDLIRRFAMLSVLIFGSSLESVALFE
jgi:DNA-binding response OmpR family regulator